MNYDVAKSLGSTKDFKKNFKEFKQTDRKTVRLFNQIKGYDGHNLKYIQIC